MNKIGKIVLILLAMTAVMANAQTNTPNRPTEAGWMEQVPATLLGQNGPWVEPRNDNSSLDLEAVVWVDDSYIGSESGFGTTLFNTIREGLAAVDNGGIVNVYPGNYTEATPNCFLYDASGPYQFGLFFPATKSNVTLQGVNAGGAPIASYANVLASVGLNATNGFGPSGLFVEGDSLTVTGLELFLTGPNYNKAVEVIGDDFTMKYCKMTDGTSCYINDFRYDIGSSTSHVQSYWIEGNLFDLGTSVDLASGAGGTGAVSGRQIINNDFEMDWPDYVDNWAAISFNGTGTGVPWFLYPVGAAVISGNTFSDAESFYIRHRGTFANPVDFDWDSYWNDNTFDKKVAFGSNPPVAMGTYSYPNSYGVFTDVKEIGANIQREIDWASSSQTVLCGNGTYNEAPNIYKSLTLAGESQAGVIINASSFSDYGIDATGDYNFGFHDFTLDGPDANISSAYGLKVSGNNATATISNLTVYGCYKTGIDLNGLTSGSITNCTSTGAAWGNGYAVTDCDNIAFSNITSSGNAWGGVAVYTKGAAFTGGSDGVTFSGTLNLAEPRPIYTELNGPAYPPITNLSVSLSAFPYVIGSTSDAYTEVYSSSQANAVATATTIGVTGWTYNRNADYFYVTPALKIQAAVAAAGSLTPVEATSDEIHLSSGTFTESVNVNKYAKIVGEGSVVAALTTVTSSSGPVFTIAASGLNGANPLLFQDLQVLPVGVPGFDVASGSWSYVKLNNVRVIGTNPTDNTENEVGLRIWNSMGYPSLSNLEVLDCAFDNLCYGWVFHKNVGAFSDNVNNVTVSGTSFTHNAAKGIYVEKLSDASFTNCEVNNNGWLTTFWNAPWNAGFDFNLKGIQSYQNISLSYCDFEGNATSTTNGAALMIKARGSGGDPSYDANPASLTNVQLTNCKIVGNERGVRFGEPGKANTSPVNSVVTDCAVYGNTNGDVINATTGAQDAGGNWWGTAAPNWGTQVIGSNVNHTPWYGVNGTYPNPGFIPLSGGISGEMSDAYLGCGVGCNATTLYLKLGVAGLPNLQVVFQLPAGFTAGPLGTVTPVSNDDPNLIQAFASDLGGGQIQVDMGFNSPYSTGDLTKYVAAIPLTYTGVGSGVYSVTGVSSLWIDGLGNSHVNDYTMTPIAINVDCTAPVISDFTTSATCAFGAAAQTVDEFSVTLTDGLSNLDSAWVTFAPGGGSFALFGANLVSPQTVSFPSSGNENAFYGNLVEGCNTLTVHLLDSECNLATTVDLANVGRDNTAPAPAVAYTQSACYNNTPGDPQYGGTLLVGDLEIDLAPAIACEASTFDLTLTILAENVNAYDDALVVTDYPSSGEATTLWSAIVTAVGGAYTGSATVNWTATDCAGNIANGNFVIPCLDFVAPTNTVTTFDARPADAGVWLNWAWTPDVNQAVEMRIYRSPITPNGAPPAGYPGYTPALRDVYDVSIAALSGWTLVETQTFGSGEVSSATESDNNNKGEFHQHLSYWLDAETSWLAGALIPSGTSGPDVNWRDIYRYVTFVKDAGGNWSTGYTAVPGTNVDHSTNYWLGDFSPANSFGSNNSRGRVDSDDLGLLSAVYFTSVPSDYRNIGPVLVENGNIGKGIPNPETSGAINFLDLVPFSFNYGMVSVIGNPLEFVIEPGVADVRPFNRLDDMPSVTIGMDSEIQLTEGTEFTVTVTMSGNDGNAVKAAEAILNYNESMLEFVSATMGSVVAPEGTMFSKASKIEGVDGQVGFVAASCGGWSTLEGSEALGTVTFRIKSDIQGTCNISLSSVKLLDNSGAVDESEGNVISVFDAAALPDNYALYQNYPNPFNPTTNIQFDLKEAGHVTILVYNTLGQMVTKVVDREMVAGRHDVTFDASSMASGLYMYSISVNGFSDLKKMVLIR